MNRAIITPVLSFALLFPAAANFVHSVTVHPQARPTTILHQTGGDPEPINPPGNGGH